MNCVFVCACARACGGSSRCEALTVEAATAEAAAATAVGVAEMGPRAVGEAPKVRAADLAACCFQRVMYIRQLHCEQKAQGRGEHSEAGFAGFTVSVGCKRTV